MKPFKKRGVGLMRIGLITILALLYPALIGKHVPAIIFQIAGWIMFVCGAIIRGKQKKEQDKLERAMYDWASERMQQRATPPYIAPQGPQPSAWAAAPPQAPGGAQRAEMDALARENAELRRRLNAIEEKVAPHERKK